MSSFRNKVDDHQDVLAIIIENRMWYFNLMPQDVLDFCQYSRSKKTTNVTAMPTFHYCMCSVSIVC